MSTAFTKFLHQSLRAGSPLVYCESPEDERVSKLARDLVEKKLPDTAVMVWTCTTGLVRVDTELPEVVLPADQAQTFEVLLARLGDPNHAQHFDRNLLVVARDAVGAGSTHEGSPEAGLRFVRLLKDLYEEWEPTAENSLRRCLLITGLGWTPPSGLNGYLQTTVLPLPSQDDLVADLEAPAFEGTLRQRGLDTRAFAGRVAGLPLLAVRDVVRRLGLPPEPGEEREDPRVMIDRIKKEEIRKTGVLEILSTDERLELGGFGAFKRWFKERRPFLETRERAELRPRGVLFLGFPGCGKSYAARWIARELGMPLIALNLGQVQERWVGASEANFRMALSTLEAAAPVVVLMDEVEKDIAGQGTDSTGVMTRLVGHLLRWLADRKAPVFIVATCNNADRIPVELTRTGRFDANFIVSLPNERERVEILSAVAEKLKLEITDDVRALIVKETHEFTGAEINQLLVEAAYKVGVGAKRLTRESIAAAKPSVMPLKHREEGQDLWAMYEKKKGAGYQLVSDI